MEKRNPYSINFKEFDLFIQSCLDKYFYAEPWKKLYDRAGRLHRDIISDKSTIPDLIIYNKSFNKSDCFYESNFNSYVKFPRMRFILRPKYKNGYDPSVTYGKDEDAITFYKKRKSNLDLENNLHNNMNLIQINNSPNQENIEIFNHKTFLNKNEKNIEEEEEEEEPQWANDNVEDFNNIKIKFRAIPKSLEDKINKDIDFNDFNNKLNKEKDEKNIIDIDKFFIDENFGNNQIQSLKTSNNRFIDVNNNKISDNKNNDNIKIKNENIKNNSENNISKFSSNNCNTNNINNKLIINSNEYFDIFDSENKYKNIYMQEDNSIDNDKNSNNNESKNDIDFSDINLSKNEDKDEKKIKNDLIDMNNNDLINNYSNNNLIKFNSINHFENNKNLINNSGKNMDKNYMNALNRNMHNMTNLNNLNHPPYNNNMFSINLPNNINLSNNNYNNMYIPNDQYIVNNKALYIKNVNDMIHRYNLQSQMFNNMNNYYANNRNNFYNNIIPINNNINYFPTRYMRLNPNVNQTPFAYSNNLGNNNILNNINNNININNMRQTNYNINNIHEQNINEHKINRIKNEEIPENILDNPLEYSDNPTRLVILKNLNKKKWIVFEKDKGNYIHNFNTRELFEFLEENNTQESFNNININDSDTDYYFPTKEIYDYLKHFYLNN